MSLFLHKKVEAAMAHPNIYYRTVFCNREGENEFHLAFVTDEYDVFHAKHKEMGCICYENPAMGIYFISDPDGYWLEILPVR